MPRRAVTLLGFGLGAGAATVLLRRNARGRRDRVDLYFADGSMVSLADGSPEGDRLLALGREVLRATTP